MMLILQYSDACVDGCSQTLHGSSRRTVENSMIREADEDNYFEVGRKMRGE